MKDKIEKISATIDRLTRQYMELNKPGMRPTKEMMILKSRADILIDTRNKMQSRLNVLMASGVVSEED